MGNNSNIVTPKQWEELVEEATTFLHGRVKGYFAFRDAINAYNEDPKTMRMVRLPTFHEWMIWTETRMQTKELERANDQLKEIAASVEDLAEVATTLEEIRDKLGAVL